MLHRTLLLVSILFILTLQYSTARLDSDEDTDEEEYRLLKRFLFHKETSTTTQRAPSVLENLIRPSSTRSPTPGTPVWTQKTTHSPSYPSSGSCSPNPCAHGGICTSKGQVSHECKCVGPWRGIYCGVADACYRSPCQNGGTCLNVNDDYWCKCTSDYYGNNCQTKFYSPSSSGDHCRANTCNTGRCVSLQTTYYCQCPSDRYGEHCEKRFSKRSVSNLRLYHHFLEQMKRGALKQKMRNHHADEDLAEYDVKNGIYF